MALASPSAAIPADVGHRRLAGLRSFRPRLPRPNLRGRFEPVQRSVAPYAEKVKLGLNWLSIGGWVALAGAVIGLSIGSARDWEEFVALGVTCAAALLFALAWMLGRSQFEVTFEMSNIRVTVGDLATGRVEILNRARRSFLPARIELAVGQGRAFFVLPGLARDESYEQYFNVPTKRRSVIRVGPVSSVRSDPLNLLRRTQRWSESVELYVHPKTVFLSSDSTGFIRDIEGVTTQDLSSNDVSFHALREYQPGDDRRTIHWRTTARVGKLMVRQFEETRRAHLLIILPTTLEDYATEADFESAISIAGSLARHSFGEEREVSVFASGGLIKTGTAAIMLDQLAALEPARNRLPMRELAARAVSAVPQASVCALIAGDSVEPRDLRAAHKTLPLSVSTFALRCSSERPLARHRIGDLTVLDIPTINSLAAAMRSLR